LPLSDADNSYEFPQTPTPLPEMHLHHHDILCTAWHRNDNLLPNHRDSNCSWKSTAKLATSQIDKKITVWSRASVGWQWEQESSVNTSFLQIAITNVSAVIHTSAIHSTTVIALSAILSASRDCASTWAGGHARAGA
jgi:hypothetical protein